MVSLVIIPVFLLLIAKIGAPPVDQKKATPTPSPAETASQEAMYNVEYERYLQEVVQLLESDDDFRKKLEKADPEDIKSGKIAEEMDFLNHNIRSKLNEIKRKEIDRLRELIREQVERDNGAHNVVMPNHLDHVNLDSFEKEDLRKLIFQTTKDLEELDRKRKEEFKEYEMEKELERRQKLANMTDEERQKAEKEYEEALKKHAEHPEVKHPGSKDQLEEVWEDVDKLPKDSFDPKTFFNLHDLTGDGYLDIAELEALFQKELDKIYDKNNPEDDMRQREEEMARMREHVIKEMDHDKDGLISMEEFLGETKKEEFKQDPGWQSIDEQPVYSQEEFKKFSEEWSKVHGVPPPAYVPPGYQQPHPNQQQPYPGQHQPPYPGQQQPYHGQQQQPYPGQYQQPPYPGQPPYPYPGQGVPPQQQQQYPYPNQGQPQQQYPPQQGGQQQQQYPNQPPIQQQQGQHNQQQVPQQQPNIPPQQQVPAQQQQQVPVQQQQQVPVQQQQQVPIQQQAVPVQQQQQQPPVHQQGVPVQNQQQQGHDQAQPIDNSVHQQPNVAVPAAQVGNANVQPVH